MPEIAESFAQGIVQSRDARDLHSGEMQEAVNSYYLPGDSERLHKLNGRSLFSDTTSSARVNGVALLSFDSDSDVLVAASGTILYSAPLQTGTQSFTSLKTGLSAAATTLSAAHYNDRWYLCNGYDRNQVVESDGTIHDMGMYAPQEKMAFVTAAGVNAITRPTTQSVLTGTWLNQSDAYDSGTDRLDTFAGTSFVAQAGGQTSTIQYDGWANATGTNRTLRVNWSVAGTQILTESPDPGTFGPGVDTGQLIDAGISLNIQFQISEDNGGSFTEVMREVGVRHALHQIVSPFAIADATNEEDIILKITISSDLTDSASTFRLYDIRLGSGSPTGNFTVADKLVYAVTEFDALRGQESPPSEITTVLGSAFISQNQITLTLPAAAQNSRATQWRIYRTFDGGVSPFDLGLVGNPPIGDTTWIDDFDLHDKDDPARPLVPLHIVTVEGGQVVVPRDTPPPILSRLRTYRGSLIGLSRNNPRSLYYSIAGRPESWSELNVIAAFPLEQHDKLVDAVEVGDTLLIGAQAAMIRIERLPRVVQGVVDGTEPTRIAGAPGLVGPYAMTTFAVAGEPMAAWASPHGIFMTNTEQVFNISRDLDWTKLENLAKTGWVLHWDPKREVLIFAYSTTGANANTGISVNNRFYLLHMSDQHRKENNMPKITGPHFGKYQALTGAQVGGRYRLYSAHPSDGKVYREDDDSFAGDDSNSFDSDGGWPQITTTRRLYSDGINISVLQGALRHTDYGAGASCSVKWSSGRDSPNRTTARTETVPLDADRSSTFGISRSGEWHDAVITQSGPQSGALVDLRLRVRGLENSGYAKASRG